MAKRKRAKRGSAIPLPHRLPNPPAVWVGRAADLDWVEAALGRAPVTLVTGPGGVGKTALVLRALHTRFARRVGKTVFVDAPAGQPAAQIRQDVLRALAASSGGMELDWPALQSDPMAAIGGILDLAEAGGFTVFVDDVHQSDVDETNEMLVAFASYARKSRFVATSRLTPRLPELAGQVLTLSAMSDEELGELAVAWAPQADAAAVRRAISSASGSPWLLSQLLVTGSSERALEEEGLLAGLTEESAELLRSLAIVEVPLPLPVLTLFAPHPGAEALDGLERRGLTISSSGGIRLHDVARGLLSRRGLDDARAAHAAGVLAHEELIDARLEAVRLFATLGRMDAVADLLEREADRFLSQGYAPRLFKILKSLAHPSIEAVKLRCAAELGNPTALAQVHAPADQDADGVLAWARTLRASGDAEDAAQQLEVLLGDAETAPGVAGRARLLYASCLRHMGRYDESRAVLDALATDALDAADLALSRDVSRALSEVLAGGLPTDGLLALRARAAQQPEATAASLDLADAFAAAGMMRSAAELAARSRPEGAGPDLLANRESFLVSATVALERGDLDEARRLADSIRAYARGSSILLPTLYRIDGTRRLIAGELDGLDPLLSACSAEVQDVDARSDVELATLRVRLAALRGDPARHALDLPPARASSRAGVEARLWESLRRARSQGALGESELPIVAELAAERRHGVIAQMILGAVAVAAGDAAGATHHAVEAVRLAVRNELRTLEAEARCLFADALVVAERWSDLSTAAAELAELGLAMGSPRFGREASLLSAFAANARLPPALLEHLASAEEVAPVAARRARALLGGEPSLDHLDLRVLETVAGAGMTDACETVGTPPHSTDDGDPVPWARGWGIDGRDGSLWADDGRTVDLSGQPQSFRILEVLAEHGGAASKEQLVRDAWGEVEYHPARHDGKLHVAVRKLRELIEDDPAAPARLATTADGYRLTGVVRWVRRS